MAVYTYTGNVAPGDLTEIVNFVRTDGTPSTIFKNQAKDLTGDEVARLSIRIVLTAGGTVYVPPYVPPVDVMTATRNPDGSWTPIRPTSLVTPGFADKNIIRDYAAAGIGASGALQDTTALKAFRDAAKNAIYAATPYDQTRNNRLGRVSLEFPPGQFVITDEDSLGQFWSGTPAPGMGLRVKGAGRAATQLIYAPTSDTTSSFMWRNDLFSRVDFEDLTLYGYPSQTAQDKRDRDRWPGFLHSRVSNSSTAMQNYSFIRVDFKGFWRDLIKLETYNNNSEFGFWFCNFYAHFKNAISNLTPGTSGYDPDQALNFYLFNCQTELSSGNLFNMPWGGNIVMEGGSQFHLADPNTVNCPNAVLSGVHDAITGTITAVSGTAFSLWPASGVAAITLNASTERIYYTSRNNQQLLGCTRGYEFTAPQAYTGGETIRQPDGGCMFLIPPIFSSAGVSIYPGKAGSTAHTGQVERLEVKSVKGEMRTVDSRVLALGGWRQGTVHFLDYNLLKGQVDPLHMPFRIHSGAGLPTIDFEKCTLPYRLQMSWETGGQSLQRRIVRIARSEIRDYDEPHDYVVFSNLDDQGAQTANLGSQPAVEFEDCTGNPVTANRHQYVWDCILNYQRSTGASPKLRRVMIKAITLGTLPSTGITSAVKWLPRGAKVIRITLFVGPQADSGVSATSANTWVYTVTDAAALTRFTSDPIANPSLGFSAQEGPRASFTTNLTGTNNDLVFTSNVRGESNIGVRYVVAGANTPLTIALSGNVITVNVATSAGSAATSTAAQVAAAIAADIGANQLVSTANAAGNDGTGVVTAMTQVNLQPTPYMFVCNDGAGADQKRKLTLNANASVSQQAVGDLLIEFLA